MGFFKDLFIKKMNEEGIKKSVCPSCGGDNIYSIGGGLMYCVTCRKTWPIDE